MDRGEEISGFVRKLYLAVDSDQELRDVVHETLHWLCASPDYRNYIEATVPYAFSLLPNEIIHDVVDSHGVKRSSAHYELRKLVQIEGSWGEFAWQLSACTTLDTDYENMVFFSRASDPGARSKTHEVIPSEEAQNRYICRSSIEEEIDLDQLTAVAPKLYEDINFNMLPFTHCKALNLMGTRFTKIRWKGEYERQPAMPDLVNFLRRQLRSNYLRDLEVFRVKFEDGAFDKEMIVFMTRPWFQRLDIDLGSLPFDAIVGAHKAWELRNVFKLKKRIISAPLSKETLGKLEDCFKMKIDFENRRRTGELKIHHPEEINANVCLRVDGVNDEYWVRMEICDL